ncbi:MAG: GerW family sporulation protein [Bacillota bacterium]
MAEHPIQGLMKTAMESIKDMVDVNTIVGDPVQTHDGYVIVPVSRVAFGFAAGGGEYAGAGGGESGGDSSDGSGTGGGGGGNSGGGDGGNGGGGPEGKLPFAGGSGAGVTIQPMGFLVVGNSGVRMLSVDGRAIFDRLIDVAPQMIGELRGLIGGASQPTAGGSGGESAALDDSQKAGGEAPAAKRSARDYRV